MILAITGIVHRYELLPYYLDHYRSLGVEKFAIACDPYALYPSGEVGELLASCSDVELHPLPRGFERSHLVGMIEEEIRARAANAEDWVIPADLDELNQYPAPLPELVRQMEADGVTHLEGELLDRLDSEGMLKAPLPFERGVSLWRQYPLEASVTRCLLNGCVEKVLLSKGDVGWGVGHHRTRNPGKPFAARGVAHHFKWRDGLAENLDWRVRNEEPAKVPWVQESIQLREYLATHGRIRCEDVEARTGWCPPNLAA